MVRAVTCPPGPCTAATDGPPGPCRVARGGLPRRGWGPPQSYDVQVSYDVGPLLEHKS